MGTNRKVIVMESLVMRMALRSDEANEAQNDARAKFVPDAKFSYVKKSRLCATRRTLCVVSIRQML